MNANSTLRFLVPVIGFALLGSPAYAEQSMLEEVVVTAQKREQSIQDVPIAITAVDGAELESNGAVNLIALDGIAPNVTLQSLGLIGNIGMVSIRGITFGDPDPNADPKTGFALDGVYYSRNSGVLSDSFDIERVEILRGPQGTLFGRNNLAGTINMISARPTDEAGGKVRVTLGENGQQIVRGVVNSGSFADGHMKAKLSASTRTYDGYTKNNATGNDLGKQEAHAARGTLVYEGESLDLTFIGDYSVDRINGPPSSNQVIDLDGTALDGNVYEVFQDLDGYSDFDTWGLSVEANREFEAGTLTFIASHRDQQYLTFGDFDGRVGRLPPPPISFHIGRDMTHDQQAVEVRFADSHSDTLDYVLGVIYTREEYEQTNLRSATLSIRNGVPLSTNGQEAESWAAFGQTDINVSENLSLVLGGRMTIDDKSFKLDTAFAGTPIAIRISEDWNEFTWRAGVNYFVNDATLLYANVATGYKGGGYNSRATIPANAGPYDPETVTSYEIGMKGDFWDNRARINVAAFLSDYEDIQGGVRRPGANPTGTEAISQNLGDVENKGIEIETVFVLSDKLTLSANLALLDAEWEDFSVDLNNNGIVTDNTFLEIPFAPDWSAYLGLDYTQPLAAGDLNFHLDVRYKDEFTTSGTNPSAVFVRGSTTRVNGHVEFLGNNERYSVSVYGRNLTDEESIGSSVQVLFPLVYWEPPRELGVEVQFNF